MDLKTLEQCMEQRGHSINNRCHCCGYYSMSNLLSLYEGTGLTISNSIVQCDMLWFLCSFSFALDRFS